MKNQKFDEHIRPSVKKMIEKVKEKSAEVNQKQVEPHEVNNKK
ncbi:hypothetical protein [Anaeromicropila populeti]|uniref:Uncharacterized protein n=1 Tax=Anaeromicropila populeti TaxID=37658 RepID=A0A1I6M227_9FIRM|nr:hypothetical protein [Anaeromicropila populeti]SFS09723.1 hypothetical protein SAMN05661086_03750 [Anaeromicropila populeti]